MLRAKSPQTACSNAPHSAGWQVLRGSQIICIHKMIWQIKTTLAHRPGRAARLRRLLADQQVSLIRLVPKLWATAERIRLGLIDLRFKVHRELSARCAVEPHPAARFLPDYAYFAWFCLWLTFQPPTARKQKAGSFKNLAGIFGLNFQVGTNFQESGGRPIMACVSESK